MQTSCLETFSCVLFLFFETNCFGRTEMWLIWNIVFQPLWNKNSSDLILQPNSVSDPTFQNEGPNTDLMPPGNEFCSASKSEFSRLCPPLQRDIVGYWIVLKDVGWSSCMDSFELIQWQTSYWVKVIVAQTLVLPSKSSKSNI